MRSVIALALALAPAAHAFVYTVGVGKDQTTGQPGIGFDPSRSVVSDLTTDNQVTFRFLEGTHRVVQSDFDSPCASNGGFDSGVQEVAAGTSEESGPTATFEITNNTGVYYFSDIGDNARECYLGAVFCLNTDESTNDGACHTFQANALALGEQNGVVANSTTSSTAAPIPTSGVSSAPTASASTTMMSGSMSNSASGTSSGSSPAASATGQSGAGRNTLVVGGSVAAVVGVIGMVAF